jgi:hypothetical protein
MTETLDCMTARKKRPEPTAEEIAAKELVRQAREQGLSLTGPGGLVGQLTKTVLETALDEELTGHPGHEKHELLRLTSSLRNPVSMSLIGLAPEAKPHGLAAVFRWWLAQARVGEAGRWSRSCLRSASRCRPGAGGRAGLGVEPGAGSGATGAGAGAGPGGAAGLAQAGSDPPARQAAPQ